MLQKPEGFRVKASEGEAVVIYREPLTTQDLMSSGFPVGLTTWQKRYHPSCPAVARRAKSDEFIWLNIQERVFPL